MPRSRVTLVPEQDAAGAAERVFAEARHALAAPFVPELLRAYATIPSFLEVMWAGVAPALRSSEFIHCADRLRAQAYTVAFNYLRPVDALAAENQEIAATLQLFHEAAPRFLLLTSVVLRAMEAPVGSAKSSESVSLASPAGIPLADSAAWNAGTRDIIDEVKYAHGTGIVNRWLEALATHPAFLRDYWNVVKPQVTSPLYARLALELRETAFTFPDDLPVVVDLTPERLADLGIGAREVAEAGRLTNLFAADYAAMLLDIEVARIATEQSQQERARTAVQAA